MIVIVVATEKLQMLCDVSVNNVSLEYMFANETEKQCVLRINWILILKVHGHQNSLTHFIHFPEIAEFSDNFDSNIVPSVLWTRKKFAFEVDNLQKRRRKRATMMASGDVMSLAYRRHEY